MTGVTAVAAVNIAGKRARARRDDLLDDPLSPPEDVTHHDIATADGGSVHVVDTGAGQPVVLLHGVTLQWWVWSAVIRMLRADHRVIAWDMRGHGRSVAGRRGVSLEACADDLTAVLETFDLRDAIVVGHSMGGMVLGRFVVQSADVARDRVGGAVFLATSCNSLSRRGIAGGLVAMAKHLATVTRAGITRPRLTYDWHEGELSAAMVRMAFGPRATGRMIDDVRRMLAEMPPQSLMEAADAVATHDVSRDLAGFAAPTVVVVGDKDRLTPPVHATAIVKAMPHASLRVLPGIGHQVMQEAPDEVVAAVSAVAAEVVSAPLRR